MMGPTVTTSATNATKTVLVIRFLRQIALNSNCAITTIAHKTTA